MPDRKILDLLELLVDSGFQEFKAFVDSHFPSRTEPNEMELRYGLYHEIMILEDEITVDQLETAYQITNDILDLAERDYLAENPGKPLDRREATILMLSIASEPFWDAYGPTYSRAFGLGPIVDKWKAELKKRDKLV